MLVLIIKLFQVKKNLIFPGNLDRKDSMASVSSVTSLPSNLSQNHSCAGILGASAIAIAGLPVFGKDTGSIIKDSKDNTEVHETKVNHELTPDSTGSRAGSRRSSLKPRGLRESFRNLVRPKVKKRDVEAPRDESGEEDEIVASRRGSRISESNLETQPSSRWKRILGVSLAISRSVLTK